MVELILLMIAGAAAVSFWNNNRAASEYAHILGRRACEAAGVQFLDDSVQLNGYAIRRRDNGWIGLDRKFHFDFSVTGADRHSGRMIIRDKQLVYFDGPERQEPTIVPFIRPR